MCLGWGLFGDYEKDKAWLRFVGFRRWWDGA